MTPPTSNPRTPQQLIDYCKRKLGQGMVEVNTTVEQESDRLAEAIQFLTQYASDFMVKTYLKHLVTQTDVNNQYIDLNQASGTVSTVNGSNVVIGTQTNFTNEFSPGVTQITISGVTANVAAVTDQTHLMLDVPATVTQNAVAASVVQASDRIIGINRVFPIGSSILMGSGIFNIKYQFVLQNLDTFISLQYADYVLMREHLESVDMLFSGSQQIQFTKHQDKLFIDCKWDELMPAGTWIVAEAWAAVNPDTYTKVYNDPFLKRYLTELLRMQWAQNLSKFGNLPLPGGVVLNWADMMTQAEKNIEKIEQDVRDTYEEPPGFFVG